MNIPNEYKQELEARIRDLARAEEDENISFIYELIYPKIRERRVRERNDEPDLTLNSIKEFTKSVEAAALEDIEYLEYHPVSKLYGGDPAIKVRYSFLYNNRTKSVFTSIWVMNSGNWYTTSVGKFRSNNA